MVKGSTSNFNPRSPSFIVHWGGDQAKSGEAVVEFHALKAVFFVKEFAGNRNYHEKKSFAADAPYQGRRIKVRFYDGEVLVGSSPDYHPNAAGFFLFPADPQSNAVKVYVVGSAVTGVEIL
jgi:hypothetical protein